MKSGDPYFKRLEQTVTMIARHADCLSKEQVVAECLEDIEDRWRQGQPAWLRLEEPTVTGWVKANIVRRAETLKVGLEFLEHCPEEFFQAATQ